MNEGEGENENPIFQLHESTFIHTVWWVAFPDAGDLLAMLVQQDGKWILSGRFRTYKDDSVFDSADEKRVFRKEGEFDELLAAGREFLTRTSKVPPSIKVEKEEHLINGGLDELLELFRSRPWAHLKTVPNTPELEEFL